MRKLCKIQTYPNGTLGLHLSRAPWDPYPWVSGVQDGSNAYQAGVRAGDTVLELNDCDVLGQKISELAAKIQKHCEGGCSYVTMLIWRNKTDNSVVNQDSLQKFAKCLQNVAQLLECPICLEIVKPPGWQCCNGHVLCNSCRGRTVKCPICRVTLGPRGRCLLSDKLFTLLAESFPCDGVKKGNSLSRNYPNDCHETPPPLIKTQIDNSPPTSSSSCSSSSSSSSSSPSPSPRTFEKVYQRKQLTENAILNHLKNPNNNKNNKNNKNNHDNNKLAVGSKSRTPDDYNSEKKEHDETKNNDDDEEDVNIVVHKLNQKSKKKNDFVDNYENDDDAKEYGSSCNLPPSHPQQYQYHHQNLPRRCSVLLGQQQELTFHCPTGKSLCSSTDRPDSNYNLDSKAKTLNCIWTQDISHHHHHRFRSHPHPSRRKLKGEDEESPNFVESPGKFITKWDILSHLTQVHQISVAQHYANFGQAVRLQLLQNFKSIPCITIQSERNWTRDKENLMQAFMSSTTRMCRERVQGHGPPGHKTTVHRSSFIQQQQQTNSTELFFVACVPLEDEENDADDDESTMADGNLKKEEGFHRNSIMNDIVHADPADDIPPSYDVVGNTAGPTSSVVVVVDEGPQAPNTGVIKIETKSKSTRKGNHSQTTTGHLILDATSVEAEAKADPVKFATSSSQSRYVKDCPTNSHGRSTGYRNIGLGVDACTWCSFQSSSHSSLSSSSSSSPSSSSSSLASYSMSSSMSSSHCCCCSSPSDDTGTGTGVVVSRQRQHAIFIWYFGNECDVKNFQTVIECKRTGLKWTGCVHPLTKSWLSLQQQQQQQQRHMGQQFLVVDSMPDGGDNFFDILIQTK